MAEIRVDKENPILTWKAQKYAPKLNIFSCHVLSRTKVTLEPIFHKTLEAEESMENTGTQTRFIYIYEVFPPVIIFPVLP